MLKLQLDFHNYGTSVRVLRTENILWKTLQSIDYAQLQPYHFIFLLFSIVFHVLDQINIGLQPLLVRLELPLQLLIVLCLRLVDFAVSVHSLLLQHDCVHAHPAYLLHQRGAL